MRNLTFVFALSIAVATFGFAQHQQDHSQRKIIEQKSETKSEPRDSSTKNNEVVIQTEYTCPMHSDVKSSKPGSCPKCKMDLVEVKKHGKKSLMKQKMEAMNAGKYSCCIEEPCDECIKAHGSCSCKKAVKDGKPVCDECYDGWKKGQGDVSGKTFKDIKKGHKH
jgi:hypothetical protein